jgi:hypothetical protein
MPRKNEPVFKLNEDDTKLAKVLEDVGQLHLSSLDMSRFRTGSEQMRDLSFSEIGSNLYKNIFAISDSSDSSDQADSPLNLLNEKVFASLKDSLDESVRVIVIEPKDGEYPSAESSGFADLNPDALNVDHYEIDEDGNVMHLPDAPQLGHIKPLSIVYEEEDDDDLEFSDEESYDSSLASLPSQQNNKVGFDFVTNQELERLSELLVLPASTGTIDRPSAIPAKSTQR